VDWEEVYYKKLKPPIVPTVNYDGDPKNYDDYPETDWCQCYKTFLTVIYGFL
jgi:hypothetical protein